jgi:hypothetical protein
VHDVAHDVDVGLLPWDQLAVVPYVFRGLDGHCVSSFNRCRSSGLRGRCCNYCRWRSSERTGHGVSRSATGKNSGRRVRKNRLKLPNPAIQMVPDRIGVRRNDQG